MAYRWGLVAALACVCLGALGTPAPATIHEHPVQCTYDAATKTVRLRLRPGYIAGFGVEEGGPRFEYYDHSDNNGYCGAGTRFNTDRVLIVGPGDTPTGGIMTHGALRAAPGATPETSGRSEIEIHLRNVRALRSYTAGTDDDVRLGMAGINYNGDGDADITGLATVDWLELSVGEGTNVVNAQGGRGTGAPYRIDGAFQVLGFGKDTMIGGPGPDRLTAYDGPSTVRGGAGNDALSMRGGGLLRGGPGADELSDHSSGDEPHSHLYGGGGTDVLQSGDGWPDSLDGGDGEDSAEIDEHYDTVRAVEHLTYRD